MKAFKKLAIGTLTGGFLFLVGVPAVSAHSVSAIPVEASMSPVHQSYNGSSTFFTNQLKWGGGFSNTYHVNYYNGYSDTIDDDFNIYNSQDRSYYSKGTSLTMKQWNTRLRVSNGTSSATATGTITLKDR